MKKIITASVLSLFFLASSCGTILKQDQVHKSHSKKLDTTIVLLDAIGLFFFLVPGIVAFAVDYHNGTLFLPARSVSLDDTSVEGIQKTLAENGYEVSSEEIELALQG